MHRARYGVVDGTLAPEGGKVSSPSNGCDDWVHGERGTYCKLPLFATWALLDEDVDIAHDGAISLYTKVRNMSCLEIF